MKEGDVAIALAPNHYGLTGIDHELVGGSIVVEVRRDERGKEGIKVSMGLLRVRAGKEDVIGLRDDLTTHEARFILGTEQIGEGRMPPDAIGGTRRDGQRLSGSESQSLGRRIGMTDGAQPAGTEFGIERAVGAI